MRVLLLTAAFATALHGAAGAQQAPASATSNGTEERSPLERLLPPFPALPDIAPHPRPPTPVLGMLSIEGVMAKSTAYQRTRAVLEDRRKALNADLQREQAALQALQKALVEQRGKLTPALGRIKEQELQQRVISAQTRFRKRDRAMQEVDRFVSGHIQQTLATVVKQVAESRSVNAVLTHGGVLLNTAALDLTGPITEQLNKVLPEVAIPPDGVSPSVAQAQRGAASTARQP